jgi:hypothetical protein
LEPLKRFTNKSNQRLVNTGYRVLRLNLNRKIMEKIFSAGKDHVQKMICTQIKSPINFDRAFFRKNMDIY